MYYMNFDNDLKQQAEKMGIDFGPGRIDSIDFDERGYSNWNLASSAIDALSGSSLTEAKKRLNLPEEATLQTTQAALNDQLIMFKFSFEAWMDSYGENNDPDEPLTWISDGTSFEDDFHRSAWVLAGCGIVQSSHLVCKGFDIPNSAS